jgi:hypothetical protein
LMQQAGQLCVIYSRTMIERWLLSAADAGLLGVLKDSKSKNHMRRWWRRRERSSSSSGSDQPATAEQEDDHVTSRALKYFHGPLKILEHFLKAFLVYLFRQIQRAAAKKRQQKQKRTMHAARRLLIRKQL